MLLLSQTFAQLRTELKNVNISNNPREFTFNTNDDPSSIVMRLYVSTYSILYRGILLSVEIPVL